MSTTSEHGAGVFARRGERGAAFTMTATPGIRSGPTRSARVASVSAGLLGAFALWVAVTAHGPDRRLFPGPPGAPRTTIYLIDNGFHTDLALPRASLLKRSGPASLAAVQTTNRPWLVFGWGDQRFYAQSGFTGARTLDAFRALFLPGNPSVVRIEGLLRSPDRIYVAGAVRAITVSDAGLARLEARIDRSLALGPDGRPLPGPATGEAQTLFYRGVEAFSVPHLCNHWTADLLHAAGLPITPVIDTLPAGLRLDLKLRARV